MVSTKRPTEDTKENVKSQKLGIANKGHSYAGYRITSPGEKLDRIKIGEISAKDFQEKYIRAHKPCIITGIIPGLQLDEFDIDNIEDFLSYDEKLQVEKKIDGGFGSGHERLRMTFHEFLTLLKKGDDSLYLTTQYDDEDSVEQYVEEEDDEEEEENEKGFLEDFSGSGSDSDSIDMNNLQDDFVDSEEEDGGNEEEEEELEILQPPLTNLAGKLPIKPILFEESTPQQINLWIGSSTKKQVDGSFQLDSQKSNFGVGRNLPNGVGTSSGLHHDHSDNLYIPIKGHKRFTLFSPYDADSLYTVGDIYKVYENGVIDYEVNSNAPNWNHVDSNGAIIIGETTRRPKVNTDLDPPSFSKIPPFYIHLAECTDDSVRRQLERDLDAHFPLLGPLNKIEVDVCKGEMLFLPCGWFHEVTSYGNEDGIHIALNYWFVPLG